MSNMMNNIQPSQDAIFENSDKIYTPLSMPKKSGKRLEKIMVVKIAKQKGPLQSGQGCILTLQLVFMLELVT